MKNPFKIPNIPLSLPMEGFCKENDYTWEDWERENKIKYPIRFFMSRTLPFWYYSKIHRPISDFLYYVKCHVLPSKKYHLLDLRQPVNLSTGESEYKFGYLDGDKKILYSCFNALCYFVEVEHKGKFEDYIKNYKNSCSDASEIEEIYFLYQWWKVKREETKMSLSAAMDKWYSFYEFKKESGWTVFEREAANAAMHDLNTLEKNAKTEETEMLIRLIKIREFLWT